MRSGTVKCLYGYVTCAMWCVAEPKYSLSNPLMTNGCLSVWAVLRMEQMHRLENTAQDKTSLTPLGLQRPFYNPVTHWEYVARKDLKKTMAISVPLPWTRAFFSCTIFCAVLGKPLACFSQDPDKHLKDIRWHQTCSREVQHRTWMQAH